MSKHSVAYRARRKRARDRRKLVAMNRRLDAFGAYHRAPIGFGGLYETFCAGVYDNDGLTNIH